LFAKYSKRPMHFLMSLLQFAIVHVCYTGFWALILLRPLKEVWPHTRPIIAIAGISACMNEFILGPSWTLFLHLSIAVIVTIVMIIRALSTMEKGHSVIIGDIENPVFNIMEQVEHKGKEKTIIGKIDAVIASGSLNEDFLENLYLKNKAYIDARPLIKTRFFTETLRHRQDTKMKFRVVTEGDARSFVSVNLREVKWLKG